MNNILCSLGLIILALTLLTDRFIVPVPDFAAIIILLAVLVMLFVGMVKINKARKKEK